MLSAIVRLERRQRPCSPSSPNNASTVIDG